MRLLVTRPEPDAAREAEALEERGHEPVLAPLLRIEFCRDVALPLEGAQGLIATSRNALRALATHPDLVRARKLPLFAVGEATAGTAKELGFAEITAGPGTASALAALIADQAKPDAGALVHLAGETLAFDLEAALGKKGFTVRAPVLYRAIPAQELPQKTVNLLKSRALDGVILLSPRTARTFAELLARHDLVTQGTRLICYCLSEAVAEAVAPLGLATRIAARPREEDVLALVDSEAASS